MQARRESQDPETHASFLLGAKFQAGRRERFRRRRSSGRDREPRCRILPVSGARRAPGPSRGRPRRRPSRERPRRARSARRPSRSRNRGQAGPCADRAGGRCGARRRRSRARSCPRWTPTGRRPRASRRPLRGRSGSAIATSRFPIARTWPPRSRTAPRTPASRRAAAARSSAYPFPHAPSSIPDDGWSRAAPAVSEPETSRAGCHEGAGQLRGARNSSRPAQVPGATRAGEPSGRTRRRFFGTTRRPRPATAEISGGSATGEPAGAAFNAVERAAPGARSSGRPRRGRSRGPPSRSPRAPPPDRGPKP